MKVKINSVTYDIPTSWDKVQYFAFAKSQRPGIPLVDKISLHTTIPEDVVMELNNSQLSSLLGTVAFQDELPEFWQEVTPTNEKGEPLEIGDEHYIKIEQSRRHLQSGNQWLAAIEITKLYTGVDISDMPMTVGMGYAVFFFELLKHSWRDTKPSANMSKTKMS